MTGATPRPWGRSAPDGARQYLDYQAGTDLRSNGPDPSDDDGRELVAWLDSITEPDMALIVLAVNAHDDLVFERAALMESEQRIVQQRDALVEACKAALDESPEIGQRVGSLIRAALLKAGVTS